VVEELQTIMTKLRTLFEGQLLKKLILWSFTIIVGLLILFCQYLYKIMPRCRPTADNCQLTYEMLRGALCGTQIPNDYEQLSSVV